MKKTSLTFMLALMTFASAMAQVGDYKGTLVLSLNGVEIPVVDETVTIAQNGSNYTLSISQLDLVLLNDIPLVNTLLGTVLEPVDIVIPGISILPLTNGYELSGGTTQINLGTSLLGAQVADVKLNSGLIVDGRLTLDLGITALANLLNIGLSFDGTLVPTGVNEVTAENGVVEAYYSLTGAKLKEEPESGLFIVKYASGKAFKVMK